MVSPNSLFSIKEKKTPYVLPSFDVTARPERLRLRETRVRPQRDLRARESERVRDEIIGVRLKPESPRDFFLHSSSAMLYLHAALPRFVLCNSADNASESRSLKIFV